MWQAANEERLNFCPVKLLITYKLIVGAMKSLALVEHLAADVGIIEML